MTKNSKIVYSPGKCVILEINELPQKLKTRNDKDSIMIAESETIGNEHRIKIKEGFEFWEDEKGVLYMKNTVPTEVYCRHANDTLQLLFMKASGNSTKLLSMTIPRIKLLS